MHKYKRQIHDMWNKSTDDAHKIVVSLATS